MRRTASVRELTNGFIVQYEDNGEYVERYCRTLNGVIAILQEIWPNKTVIQHEESRKDQ